MLQGISGPEQSSIFPSQVSDLQLISFSMDWLDIPWKSDLQDKVGVFQWTGLCLSEEKKIDGIRFFFFDMKANLSTDIFPTLKMVEWRSPVPKSNFPPDHPLGLLNAATLAIQGHKTHTKA